MAKYAILTYWDEAAATRLSPEEQQQAIDAWWEFEAELAKHPGVRLAGEALQPTPTATSVRFENGKALTTDGPFAETKEQLGGFYILDVKDLNEALEWARKMPMEGGTVEVRPIQEFEPPQ